MGKKWHSEWQCAERQTPATTSLPPLPPQLALQVRRLPVLPLWPLPLLLHPLLPAPRRCRQQRAPAPLQRWLPHPLHLQRSRAP